MNLYPMLRPLLFSLEPETAHEVTLKLLNLAHRSGLARLVNCIADGFEPYKMNHLLRQKAYVAAG